MFAIIPARGGSKRIPRKNIKHIGGIPLLAHSIISAKKSELFDKIIVSTDDDEIEDIAYLWGAEIHRRDKVSDTDTIVDFWEMFKKPFCCLLPNPFINPEDLRESFKLPGDVWSVNQISEKPVLFQDAGQFYWIRGGKRMLYIVEKALDINTLADWKTAEEML
jgi:hypothetical protein